MFGPCCMDDFCCAPGSYCCAEHPNKNHLHDIQDLEGIEVLLRMGNLSAAELEAKTGLEFSNDERAALMASRSGQAKLTGPEDWHAFDSPGISVSIGSATSQARYIFEAADIRKKANIEIPIYVDEGWKSV